MGYVQARLRPGKDNDIASWLEEQENKSASIRRALRHHIRNQGEERVELAQRIAESVVRRMGRCLPEALHAAVRTAVAAELEGVEDAVAHAMREGLHRLALREDVQRATMEHSETAVRIDEQLSAFFDEG